MDTLLRDKLTYLRDLLDEVTDLTSYTLTSLHESLLLHTPPHITTTLHKLTQTQQRTTNYLQRAYHHYRTASDALGVPSNGAMFAVATAVCTRVVVHMLLARLTLWRVVKLLLLSVVLSLSSSSSSSSTAAAALPSAPSSSAAASSSSPSVTSASALPAAILSALLSQSPSIALSLSSIAQAYWVVGQQVLSLLLTLSGMSAGSGSGSGGGGGSDMSNVMGRVVDVVDKLRKETSNSLTSSTGVETLTRTSSTG